jgi:hypothetical protein
MTLSGGPTGRIYSWLEAFAPCRQKSRIRAGGVGPAISSWLSKMVTAPNSRSARNSGNGRPETRAISTGLFLSN